VPSDDDGSGDAELLRARLAEPIGRRGRGRGRRQSAGRGAAAAAAAAPAATADSPRDDDAAADDAADDAAPVCAPGEASAEAMAAAAAAHEPGQLLVVEALKAKLRQQEQLLRQTPRCQICLGPYDQPYTSIQCWHVHCRACWLQSLGAKKVCPQCTIITAPGDLRRIYL